MQARTRRAVLASAAVALLAALGWLLLRRAGPETEPVGPLVPVGGRGSVQDATLLPAPTGTSDSATSGVPARTPTAPRTLRGRVVRGEVPVPDAAVWTVAGDGDPGTAPEAARSEADGTFALGPVPPPEDWIVAVAPNARPFARRLRDLPTTEGHVVLSVEAEGPHRVEGVVVDDDGAPVVGATVEAWGRLGEEANVVRAGRLWAEAEIVRVRTDAEGRFRLDLADEPRRLVAKREGYLRSREARVDPARATQPVTLSLRRLLALTFVAVDATTGETVRFAEFGMSARAGGWQPTAVFDHDLPTEGGVAYPEGVARTGFVRGGVIPASTPLGPTRLRVSAPGYRSEDVEAMPVPWVSRGRLRRVALTRLEGSASGLGPARFEAKWPDGEGLTARLSLEIRRQRETWSCPVWFVRGECTVALPAGTYDVSLAGSAGSTLFWREPARSTGGGGAAARVEVGAGSAVSVPLALAGGRIVLGPKTESGVSLREMTFVVDGTAIETWTHGDPFTYADSGLVLYADAGRYAVEIRKFGFDTVRTTLDVGDGAAPVVWAPVLRRSRVAR